MPSFNGVPIFGSAVVMQAGIAQPYRSQRNQYPGLDGYESLRQGGDGSITTVTGRLGGTSGIGLSNNEELFYSYMDGNTYTLVDTIGVGWLNVELESFVPQGRIERDFGTGNVWRAYAAKFIHRDF